MNSIAINELFAIFRSCPKWITLAWQDIKLRYRRSSLGPLWITLSTAITIYTMAFLYSYLFRVKLEYYFPYLAAGIIGWTFISSLINDNANAFIESESYIKNSEICLSIFLMRLILRNFIIFLHNLLVFIPIVIIFKLTLGLKLILLIPGLLIISLNAIFWGGALAILGTRFRDFSQITSNFVQVVFLLTPIMWMPTSLPERIRWFVLYNPFEQLLNLIRNPLIGEHISRKGLSIVVIITLLGFIVFSFFIKKYKFRVVYWL